jgi:hypothetical protein
MSPPTLAAMYDQANGDAESSLMDAGLQPEQEAPMQPEQEAPVVQPEAEQAPSEGGVDETASAMLDVPSESGASRGCTEPAAQDIASIHRQNDVQLSKPPHVHVSCPPSISDGPSQPAAQQAGQVEAEPMLSVLAAVVCAGAAASSVVAATSLELPATANDPSHAAGRGRAPLLQSLVSGAERAPAGRSLFASVSHMCAFRSYRCSSCIARMAAAPLRPHRMENPAGPPPPYLVLLYAAGWRMCGLRPRCETLKSP